MTRLSMGEAINLALSEAFESDQPIVHDRHFHLLLPVVID